MKFNLLLSLTLLTALSHSPARADDAPIWLEQKSVEMPETPVPDSLILIGRGIKNRKTHEILAATCSDENCTQIRFVDIQANGAVRYIGNTYEIASGEIAQKVRRQLIKSINHDFQGYRRAQRDAKLDKNVLTRVGTFVITTGPVLLAANVLVTAGMLSAPVAALLIVPAAAVVIYTFHRGVLNGTTATTQAFRDQNGWNWSSRPKTMNARKFGQFVSFLNRG